VAAAVLVVVVVVVGGKMQQQQQPRQQPLRSRRWLGYTRDKSLEKMVLEALGPGGLALDIYKKYLKSSCSYNVAYGRVALLDDSLLREFYVHDSPDASPKYLDFFSGPDLAKLEYCVGRRLVITMRAGGKVAAGRWFKIHDYRIWDRIKQHGPASLESAAEATAEVDEVDGVRGSAVLYLQLETDGRHWFLYSMDDEASTSPGVVAGISTRQLEWADCPSLDSERHFIDPSTALARWSGCLHESLAKLLPAPWRGR
jgi:hypothetical protein